MIVVQDTVLGARPSSSLSWEDVAALPYLDAVCHVRVGPSPRCTSGVGVLACVCEVTVTVWVSPVCACVCLCGVCVWASVHACVMLSLA